ncbi:hypothetical protein EZ428_19075 [Pedobacter frigiditerrae]|uniref:Uncharacterized protein n=1 Tax=Pedobacter frigiditerrae TaxID=2530452 RepID=A0A4R0MPI2_9SPHI|nr:hypothetical protein [Pedobacter frigiditerrae]TCC88738.1 hypothetical protein EZ428_19075 [Pedobacter frigiditerrae]
MKFKKNWLITSTTNRYLLLVVLVFTVICFGFKNFDNRSQGYGNIAIEVKADNINAVKTHTPGHPKKNEHQVMADTLVSFIRQNGIWK